MSTQVEGQSASPNDAKPVLAAGSDDRWTEAETSLLKERGFTAYGSFADRHGITLHKEIKYNTMYYSVGIEGTAYDVDGDLGWCRSWSSYKSLDEALGACR